jgi:hypothetical protein
MYLDLEHRIRTDGQFRSELQRRQQRLAQAIGDRNIKSLQGKDFLRKIPLSGQYLTQMLECFEWIECTGAHLPAPYKVLSRGTD